MRSQHADTFNHDEDAAGYDADVLNESHPIRAGYEATLNWVSEQADIQPGDVVLDLGSGTGNLSLRVPDCADLVCVDISAKMTEIARDKLKTRPNVRFIHVDLLEYFHQDDQRFDAIVSTYAVHHLTEDEKLVLFQHVWDRLDPGGRAVFGDLMVENESAVEELKAHFRANGHPDVTFDMDEEFFWRVEPSVIALTDLGFEVQMERFSELSWGIAARKP